MLIDRLMPRWDVRERHGIHVPASPEHVYGALRSADLGAHPLVRVLLGLRALPAALAGGRRGLEELRRGAREPITLAALLRRGFSVLAEDPPREMVLGLEGAFWRAGGDLRPVDAGSFGEPVPAGLVRAAWNFSVEPAGGEACVLRTETRVLAGSAAGMRFRLYWLLVRPGSGLIRRLMLRAVRRQALRIRAGPGARRG